MKRIESAIGVPVALLESIVRQAVDAWPEECCGVVTGSAVRRGHALRLKPCRNAANVMHDQDPIVFPRDAKTAFVLDSDDQRAIERENREEAREYFLFYHSHAQHDAYFSEEDRRAATFPFGEPNHPDAWHLVVSIVDRKPSALYLCRWDEAAAGFIGERFPLEAP